MIKSILSEYGLGWLGNRALYSAKLKMLKIIPKSEYIFERNVEVKRIDIIDIDIDRIKNFLETLPSEAKKEIIEIADNAIEGRIKAFMSIDLEYGNPINWHLNPLTQVSVDKSLKWYMISDFDSLRGDIKVIWEASRFTHFFYFVRAYLLTNDEKYYKAYVNQLDDWIKENKYSYGVNSKCGQESALRMINALFAYSAFKECGFDNKKERKNIVILVSGSYKKIISNFFYAHQCIKNNHTLSEIAGMIVGAWCCKDNISLERAYKLLDNEIGKQFLSDGGYIQYSFNYQRFAMQILEFVLKIGSKTNLCISTKSKNRLIKSVHMMYQLQDITGDVPNYGANDGALIFPVSYCNFRDYRPTINSLNVLLTGKRLFEPNLYDEEILWFSSNDLPDISFANIKKVSSMFNASGIYSLRRSEDSFLMVILQNYKTRPSHMDQLHIDIWHKGKNIICDCGSYSYASDMGRQMTLTSSHNTIQADGIEQMSILPPFLIYRWTSARGISYKDNCFSGTMLSKNGYKHSRSIKMTEDRYLINDVVKANGKVCTMNLHTPCDIKIVSDGVELLERGSRIAKIKIDGTININKSYRSLYYLKPEAITTISVSNKVENNCCKYDYEFQLF